MRKKHLIRNILFIAGAFILLLVILAEIFKEDIVKMAIKKGANTFDVPLVVGEVDFSLLYRFPLATIEFNDLAMLNQLPHPDSLNQHIDTVASISRLYASVDLIELTRGNIFVKKIDIKDAKAKYLVDSLGNSNFDFLFKASETDSTKTDEKDTTIVQGVYSLEKLTLSNIDLEYIDEYMNFSGHLNIPDLSINGELEPKGYVAETKGEILLKSIHYADFHLEELKQSSLSFDVSAFNDSLEVRELTLNAAGSEITALGTIVTHDSLFVDLNLSGNQIDLSKNIALLPEKMRNELKLKQGGGILNVSGTTKGFISPSGIPQFNINIDLSNALIEYDVYPVVKNIILNSNISSGYTPGLNAAMVNIKQLHAETTRSSVDLSAILKNPNSLEYDIAADISASLDELKPYLQDSSIKKASGIIKAHIKTNGVLPDSITPGFTDKALANTSMNISLHNIAVAMDSIPSVDKLNGKFIFTPGNIKISDFKASIPEYNINITDGIIASSFKGKLSNYKKLDVKLDTFMVAMPQSSIAATGKITGLENIKYDLRSSIKLGLGEIKEMLPDSLANYMGGEIDANISSSGNFHIDSVADKALELLFENSKFNVALNNVTLEMPDSMMNVTALSGHADYQHDTLKLNKVIGSYLGLDFSADSTTVSNVYTAAVQNNEKELYVHGNFGAGDLDYAWINAFMTDTVPISEKETQAAIKEQTENPYIKKFTTKINGKARLRSFKYGDIFVENIDTKFLAKVDEGYFVADDMLCSVFGGDARLSVRMDINNNFRDLLQFRSNFSKLDVSRMMDELEAFIDQEDFKKENVFGNLSGHMDGRIVMKDYNLIYDSLMVRGDIKLENGSLVNVKPVMAIEKIPMTGLKNLDDLKFSTLDSKIFLYNNELYIPQTQIVTSSFDASFLGMYSLGEDYAYHVRVFLGEILAGKSKANIKKQASDGGFAENEEEAKKGRTPLYLVSKSENGKEKAWWDKESDRKRMINTVRVKQRILGFNFFPEKVTYETE